MPHGDDHEEDENDPGQKLDPPPVVIISIPESIPISPAAKAAYIGVAIACAVYVIETAVRLFG